MKWKILSVLWILNFATPCASAPNVLQLKRFASVLLVGVGVWGQILLFPLRKDVCFSQPANDRLAGGGHP